jgi:hypothetical protein
LDADAALLYIDAIEALKEAGSQQLITCSHEHVPDARLSAKKETKSQGMVADEATEVAAESHLHAAAISFVFVVFDCISARPCTRETIRPC